MVDKIRSYWLDPAGFFAADEDHQAAERMEASTQERVATYASP
jgi:hypothetical protein